MNRIVVKCLTRTSHVFKKIEETFFFWFARMKLVNNCFV